LREDCLSDVVKVWRLAISACSNGSPRHVFEALMNKGIVPVAGVSFKFFDLPMVGQAVDPVARTVDDIEYTSIRSVLLIVLFACRGLLNEN
jgi:hypothetical protein